MFSFNITRAKKKDKKFGIKVKKKQERIEKGKI